ncbi:MAG: hypothetical protein Q4F30_07090 [Akkermansia sp.]|nr:hypothetical protein [Akkermansia sp.]
MDPWFEVKKKDVIAVLEKHKGCFPWGGSADEKYGCLVFWDEGKILMSVDSFYESGDDTYECNRCYMAFIGNALEDYTRLTEAELAEKAYSAWCSGAR